MKTKLMMKTLILSGALMMATTSMADDRSIIGAEFISSDAAMYTVQKGDTLRSIAAKFELTDNDALQWPLLYVNNSKVIQNPDVIIPGTKLLIKQEHNKAKVDSARNYAKARGNNQSQTQQVADANYLAKSVSKSI